MKVVFTGIPELETALRRKGATEFFGVINDSVTEMFNRASQAPYTPRDTGELTDSRNTTMASSNNTGIMGYNKDYAPHVEYGHRTRGGGYVQGQYYLKSNVDRQRPIYKSHLIEEMKK